MMNRGRGTEQHWALFSMVQARDANRAHLCLSFLFFLPFNCGGWNG